MTAAADRHLRPIELPVAEAPQALSRLHDHPRRVQRRDDRDRGLPRERAGLPRLRRPDRRARGRCSKRRGPPTWTAPTASHALLNVVEEPAADQHRGAHPRTRGPARRASARMHRAPPARLGRRPTLARALLSSRRRSASALPLDATPLLGGPIALGPPPRTRSAPALVAGPRIGITRAVGLPWRLLRGGQPPHLAAVAFRLRGLDTVWDSPTYLHHHGQRSPRRSAPIKRRQSRQIRPCYGRVAMAQPRRGRPPNPVDADCIARRPSSAPGSARCARAPA